MGITGDTSKLSALAKRLSSLVGIAAQVAPKVAPVFKGFVRRGFETKVDPYGGAWKGVKKATLKRGTLSALVRTGRMRDEIDVLPFGTRVKIFLGTFYARFHISTGRRTLPKPGRLPDPWSEAIDVEAEKVVRGAVERS